MKGWDHHIGRKLKYAFCTVIVYVLYKLCFSGSGCSLRERRNKKLKGSVKEPNILIYFFFRPSLNRVLFPMFCLLVEEECQTLVF